MNRTLDAAAPVRPVAQAPVPRSRFGFFSLCWALYLVATPIYIFPSGYPQPADGLMAIMVTVLLIGYGLRVPKNPDLYVVVVLFLGHVAIVNWIWWTQYKDIRFILSSAYYAYNFGIFMLAVSLVRRYGEDAITITRAGLTIAVALALLFCLAYTGSGRVTGTFNNPNQLGYWSLLAVACFLVLKGEERLGLPDVVFLAAASFLTALSLSRAAMLALFALLIVALISHGVRLRLRLAAVVVLVGLAPVLVIHTQGVVDGLSSLDTVANVADRLESTGQRRHDSFAARGYDRIWLYPQYLIFGAGEGAFDRFSLSRSPGIEMHSTFGTLLFSYGIIGLVLFSTALYLILRHAMWRHIMYFGIISFYGLTHQGLRFSLLWVFLGLVYAVAHYVRRPRGGGGVSRAT